MSSMFKIAMEQTQTIEEPIGTKEYCLTGKNGEFAGFYRKSEYEAVESAGEELRISTLEVLNRIKHGFLILTSRTLRECENERMQHGRRGYAQGRRPD